VRLLPPPWTCMDCRVNSSNGGYLPPLHLARGVSGTASFERSLALHVHPPRADRILEVSNTESQWVGLIERRAPLHTDDLFVCLRGVRLEGICFGAVCAACRFSTQLDAEREPAGPECAAWYACVVCVCGCVCVRVCARGVLSRGGVPYSARPPPLDARRPGCAQDLSWGSLGRGGGADEPTLLRQRRGDRWRPRHLSPTGACRGEQGERIAADPVAAPFVERSARGHQPRRFSAASWLIDLIDWLMMLVEETDRRRWASGFDVRPRGLLVPSRGAAAAGAGH